MTPVKVFPAFINDTVVMTFATKEAAEKWFDIATERFSDDDAIERLINGVMTLCDSHPDMVAFPHFNTAEDAVAWLESLPVVVDGE